MRDTPYCLQGDLKFFFAVRLADKVGSDEMIEIWVESFQVELLDLKLLVMSLFEPDNH